MHMYKKSWGIYRPFILLPLPFSFLVYTTLDARYQNHSHYHREPVTKAP